MSEVYLIDSSLIAEHAEGMLDRELTVVELRLAVEDVRCQLDRNIQSLIETAITNAVKIANPETK